MTTPMSTPTSVSPEAGRIWRAARAPVAVALVILLTALVLALLGDSGRYAPLDPDSPEPGGARALARLLEGAGVRIIPVHTAADAEAALAQGGATLLVTQADLVVADRLDTLRERAAGAVLIAPRQDALDRVVPGLTLTGDQPVALRRAGCALPSARAAGEAETGGLSYRSELPATSCYEGTLVQLARGGTEITVLGGSAPMTNESLAGDGNAALSMWLLGVRPRLVWYVPSPGDPSLRAGERSVYDLMPRGWVFAAIQLAVASALLAAWRARRLGPVITEPLPVVVRAAETVEGRARLYRRARAVDHAADILRRATRDRLLAPLGLGPRAEPAVIVGAVAARTGRPAPEVGALLYGPPPADDPGLVRLADLLDTLEAEVGSS
jgi:hypothetical protein